MFSRNNQGSQPPPPAYGQPQQPVYGQPPPAYGQPVYGQAQNGGAYQRPMGYQPPPNYNAQAAYAQPVNYNFSQMPSQSQMASRDAGGSNQQPKRESSNQQHTCVAPVPSTAECKELLKDKSEDDLKRLRDNKDEMKILLATHKYIENHELFKQSLVTACETLANENLEKGEEYEGLKAEINAEKDRLKHAQDLHNDTAAQCRAQAKSTSKEALLARLAQSADDAEALADSIASEYVKGDVPFKEFYKSFLEHRKAYHLRNNLLERYKLSD